MWDELRVAEQIIDGVQGQETYEDGSSYEGQLADGRRHGHGTWTSVAEQYCGQWVHDQRHGKGKQTWQDGRAYEGNFKQGKFHGKGRMEWHTPKGLMLYDGEYFEDLKHGHGKYIWPDGRMYEGGWKEGLRCGQATYTNAQGQSRTGIWKDDKVERWLDDAPPAPPSH
ncbi:PIP5K1 [Symbiodinium microadriaticum]|nr:PIP5K1 [Symbiodinium microadriaticum]